MSDCGEKCSIGKITNSECHKRSYTRNIGLINIHSLSEPEKNLLIVRSGVSIDLVINVCEHHKVFYLGKFESFQKNCFDPFKTHKKKITKALRHVSFDLSEKINSIPAENKAVPGFKMCDACRGKVQKHLIAFEEQHDNQIVDSGDSDNSISELERSVLKEEALRKLNSSLTNLGESPLKLHSVPSHSKAIYAKKKLASASSNIKEKVISVLEHGLSPVKSNDNEIIQEIKQKAQDMDILINCIKEKLLVATTRCEKIQLLTLAPTSWSKKKIMEEFQVSDYAARQARSLVQEKGILAVPQIKKGKLLSENTRNLVEIFFQNDEFSRILPGKKDKVSISSNVHMQKRLLLLNLNELYSSFKFEYPNEKVGFSKFCMLRPKWCVLAGSAGTHSVCVCAIHQNVSLLLQASAIDETYKELIGKLKCSTDNRDCMLGHCDNCPPRDNLKQFLLEKFDDCDLDEEISYSSWVSTDRTQQVTITVSLEEYIDTLISSLEILAPHSFIAKSQSQYLKNMKENLAFNQAVVLLDFSENYSYVIQDEVQGYHWTRDSCSLHPVVIYTRSEDAEIVVSSLCVLSDDLEHDVAFVYETQKIVVNFLKDQFPNVTDVNYFSDGCAGQYKNCKNFINICNHTLDFNLSATWTFFATSHGKSPCDEIGGTIKRLIARKSLQNSSGDVIVTVEKVFTICSTNIDNIRFWLLKKETLSRTRQQLENRFSHSKTIPGTRSFHHFVPLSNDTVGTKRISADEDFTLIFNFSGTQQFSSIKMTELSTNSYIACVYDNHWFFGVILSKHDEEGDVKVKFMHPFGPAPSYHWPTGREDICYVPLCNIISKVSTPITKASGRVYYFSEEEEAHVRHQYQQFFMSYTTN